MGEGASKHAVLTIPLAQQERIYLQHLAGTLYARIAQTEKRNRETVAKVIAVRAKDAQAYIAKMREPFLGIAGAALACVNFSIESGNAEMTYRLLEDVGVVPTVGERPLVPLERTEDLPLEEQARAKLFSQLSPVQS